MTWEDAISEWTVWLAAQRIAPTSIRLYRHYARQLSTTAATPAGLTLRGVERFVARYARLSASSQKSARQVTVSFCGWAARHGVLQANVAAGLPSVRGEVKIARPMPEAMMVRGLQSATAAQRRMVLLARYDGLRAGEISVVHSDDWVRPMLLVHGKGAKERELPVVHPELLDALDHLDGWLFPSSAGGHLQPATVATYMGSLFPKGWSAHRLRTAFATEAYRRNPDLLALQRLMGHALPQTTQRYVRLDDEAALRVVEAAYGPAPALPPIHYPGRPLEQVA